MNFNKNVAAQQKYIEIQKNWPIIQLMLHCNINKAIGLVGLESARTFRFLNFTWLEITMMTPEQIVAAQKANLESLFGLTTKAFEGVEKLVQVGIRDFCSEEWDYINNSNGRVVTYFDKDK